MLATTEINWGLKPALRQIATKNLLALFFFWLPVRLNPQECTELLSANLLRQQPRSLQLGGCGHLEGFFHAGSGCWGSCALSCLCLSSHFLFAVISPTNQVLVVREPEGRDQPLCTRAGLWWGLWCCCGVQVQQLGWSAEKVFCLLWAKRSQSSGLCSVFETKCVFGYSSCKISQSVYCGIVNFHPLLPCRCLFKLEVCNQARQY